MNTTTRAVEANGTGSGRRGLAKRDFLPALIVVVALIAIGVFVAATTHAHSFYYPLGLFSYVMGWTGLPLAYPLLAVAVFVLPFSQKMRHRHIFYTRVRRSIQSSLIRAAVTNAAVAFCAFFIFVLIFCFVFYVQPALGLTHFDTFAAGTYPEDFQLSRMTELLKVSPLVYGLTYAAWAGMNASMWASVGLVAVLTIHNRFFALALPLVLFIALGFILGALGGTSAQVAPWSLWVLFGIRQVSMLPAIVTLALFVVAISGATFIAIARADHLSNLR